jgi:hypothetical protein
MDSTTQVTRLLRALRKNPRGVENYRFPAMGILRYSARIADLRKEGFVIVAERVFLNGRATGVYKYRLIEEHPKPTLRERFRKVSHV